jgi:hypothetical protein
VSPERPQLTHRVLDGLAAQLELGELAAQLELVARNTDVRDVTHLVRLSIHWMPALIEAARQVIPGETLAEVRIPGFVPKGSLNSREHHMAAARRVSEEHAIVSLALNLGARDFRGQWDRVGRVVITRNSTGKPDSDQVYGYCKGTRDAVAKFLGIDDGSDAVKWEVVAGKCKRAEAGTVIRFERREA